MIPLRKLSLKKILTFSIVIILIITLILKITKKDKLKLLNNTIDNAVQVNKYFIYGNHLNISGDFKIDNYDEIKLVLKSTNNEIELNSNISDGHFESSSYINEGIYLDNIPIGDYFVFLKTTTKDKNKYYNLSNKTNYNDLNYYTITKNKKNNLINIKFSSYSNKEFLSIKVTETKLPDNYYDIVIDAGHGGEDPGASYTKHSESDITLDYALNLKEALQNIGLKVKLTRDNDTSLDSYGINSRTGIVYETNAKYTFSIHLNSSEDNIKSGGVEIYSPNGADTSFAENLARHIVNSAQTNFSHNESFKIKDGVYIRTFTKNDINSSITTAKEKGYNPYPITTDTTYYFMIRETGGIATGAYVDGRNKSYDKNPYYNNNIGSESYLMELGFINYQKDLNNLLYNQEGYINGIVEAIKEEINL